MQDVWMGLIKPFVFGFVIVTIACHVGLRTSGGTAGRRQSDDRRRGRRVGGGDCGRLLRDADPDRVALLMRPMSVEARPSVQEILRRARRAGDRVRSRAAGVRRQGRAARTSASRCSRGTPRSSSAPAARGSRPRSKIITGLLRADAGVVWVNGQRVDQLTEHEMMAVRADLGMIFQEGALFDSLTVRENVGYKLYEETDMPIEEVDRRVEEVLGFIGLGEHIDRMPSELSGGQRRRVAIARAMAFKPRILLYDEATTGLDPITATTVDDEIIKLRDLEGVSSIVVTHQLRDAFYVATHMAVRGRRTGQVQHRAGDAGEGAGGRVHHAQRRRHLLRRRRGRAAAVDRPVHQDVSLVTRSLRARQRRGGDICRERDRSPGRN